MSSLLPSIFKRIPVREVNVGGLLIGSEQPVRIQTMTTTDTMDTAATVAQTIRCIDAGAELVRITAPSKNEAENLRAIKDELNRLGFKIPLIADIHFTPNAAEVAARIVEKVRINPGNYADKKRFENIDYTDAEYAAEIERIRERFLPLVKICKEHGTAMRIGTNHGSLSDRIMSRYGDSPMGMVESAMEFLRIARDENYHNIILSMKSSNPLVMIGAYRLLVEQMQLNFKECYPLHLGVTEAGDGEDGRIKSAIGIGTLMEDGIGDTIRVSLTEDPEFEIPVCRDLRERYAEIPKGTSPEFSNYNRRKTRAVQNMGGGNVPVVIADFMLAENISAADLQSIGYRYDGLSDKWNIADNAADYIYTAGKKLDFQLPGTLNIICDHAKWRGLTGDKEKYFPLFTAEEFLQTDVRHPVLNFVSVNTDAVPPGLIDAIAGDTSVVLCAYAARENKVESLRRFFNSLTTQPVIIAVESMAETIDKQLIEFSAGAGAVMSEGKGDGIWLMNDPSKMINDKVSGRTYLPFNSNHSFLNNTSFSILQAVRVRISKTEYISCPSCGRTLFDLQETTTRIRNVTNHLKGLKIAVMGCIVNGPGEMADADFGYVGSGPGKITLYKGKDVVKKNIPSEVAVDELIGLLKENGVWIEKEA